MRWDIENCLRKLIIVNLDKMAENDYIPKYQNHINKYYEYYNLISPVKRFFSTMTSGSTKE